MSTEPVYADVGKRIEVARINARLTQAELGARLAHPLKRATIGNIETGRQRILAHVLIEIADVLDVAPREFLPIALPREQDAGDRVGLVAELLTHGIDPDVAERTAAAVCEEP